MKCYYHPNIDAVGQCAQCSKFGCRQCLDDVGAAVLCTSCLAFARQQMAIEEARLVAQARRAVTASSALAVVLFVFTAFTTMMVSVQSDGNILVGTLTLFFFTLSSYVTWSGFWGWAPLYRALKTSMAETGCIFLATPIVNGDFALEHLWWYFAAHSKTPRLCRFLSIMLIYVRFVRVADRERER